MSWEPLRIGKTGNGCACVASSRNKVETGLGVMMYSMKLVDLSAEVWNAAAI